MFFCLVGISDNGDSTGRVTDTHSRTLVQSANTDVVLGAAVSALLGKTGANGAAVALEKGGRLLCQARAGEIAPDVGIALSVDTGITSACVRGAKLLHCCDAQLDGRVDAAVCRNLGIRSILVTPIIVDGAVVGIVEALSIRPNAFEPGHVKWFEAIADWLRDVCCRSNQNIPRLPLDQAPSEPKQSGIISDEFPRAREQSAPNAAHPRAPSKHVQQDPGPALFREILEHMPVASSWEDICSKLVPRLVA
jgi:putative methionine-R-sulfoxide reductase with GAF domain